MAKRSSGVSPWQLTQYLDPAKGTIFSMRALECLGTRSTAIFAWSEASRARPAKASFVSTLGIQSPKLRMVSWNLNTLRFGGDEGHPNHHLTFGDWIPRGRRK